jgi:hypothetical protein
MRLNAVGTAPVEAWLQNLALLHKTLGPGQTVKISQTESRTVLLQASRKRTCCSAALIGHGVVGAGIQLEATSPQTDCFGLDQQLSILQLRTVVFSDPANNNTMLAPPSATPCARFRPSQGRALIRPGQVGVIKPAVSARHGPRAPVLMSATDKGTSDTPLVRWAHRILNCTVVDRQSWGVDLL